MPDARYNIENTKIIWHIMHVSAESIENQNVKQ